MPHNCSLIQIPVISNSKIPVTDSVTMTSACLYFVNILPKNDLINFGVSENRVKNLIFAAIDDYLKSYEKIEDIVFEKIDKMQENRSKKLVVGSEEYELIFDKLYQEELRKKGML